MQEIETGRIGPDELIFYLETNRAVDAHRFSEFLGLLINADVDRGIPSYEADILELGTGSLFGKLRLRFNDPLPVDQAEELPKLPNRQARRRAAAKQRKPGFAERQAIAAERQAAAAEKGLGYQKGGLLVGGLTLAATVAALLLSIEGDAKSAVSNSSAELIAEIMDADGVTAVRIRSQQCDVRILREDVPAYQRLQDRMAPQPRGPLASFAKNLVDEEDLYAHDGPLAPKWIPEPGQWTGYVKQRGDLWEIAIDDGARQIGTAVVMMPGNDGPGSHRVALTGTLYKREGAPDLILPEQWNMIQDIPPGMGK